MRARAVGNEMSKNQSEADSPDRTVDEILTMCREAALKIDPSTAEVVWWMIVPGDPYGLFPIPGDACAERGFFARNPGDEIWVSFDDLPKPVAKVLLEKHGSKLFFIVPGQFIRTLV